MRHIPKSVRSLWAEVVFISDTWVLKDNSLDHWLLRLARAKLCLRVPPRRGRKTVDTPIRKLISTRCRQFLRGEFQILWDDLQKDLSKRTVVPKSQADDKLMENNARRARTLAAEGDLSRACSALSSLGMAKDC